MTTIRRALLLHTGMRTLAMLVALTTAVVAATPAQNCRSAKNKEAGRYGACRLKAEAKFATTADAARRTADQAKCQTKYQARWLALEIKAVAQGGECPSVADVGTIQAVTDQHTSNVATAVGGGVLQDCPADLQGYKEALGICEEDLSACQALPSGRLLRTGQTACYDTAGAVVACAGSGQDGELQKGLARTVTDNGDGTITDTNTGLMWEKLSDDGSIHDWDATYTWANAFLTKVATLNATHFAGFTDWRVPNYKELVSLLNLGGGNPAIDAPFHTACTPSCSVLTCSCTQPFGYWSSTTIRSPETDSAWAVDFSFGNVIGASKVIVVHVRAVRGGS